MYAREVIVLVAGSIVVLLVPAMIWFVPVTHKFRNGRNKRKG
jgi:hypothetical protein